MPNSDQTSAAALPKDMPATLTRQLHDLELLYHATEYRVDHSNGQLILRIGQLEPAFDRFLQTRLATTWAFITAENPGSIPLAPAANLLRRQEMESRIRMRGWESYAGQGVGPDGYAEQSLLVLGITQEEAADLARQFGQLAILIGEIGKPTQLLWC